MPHFSPHVPGEERAGFSLIEVLCALAVLLVSALAFSRALVSSLALSRADEERARAAQAARAVLEELGDQAFAHAFRLYDAESANDPGGAGTAPGPAFDVPGLAPRTGDDDGRVGEIVFPVIGAELRENLDEPSLGMPRDLNADGEVDDADHSADYELLPVLVRVAWEDRSGPMQLELRTILAER